jgi:hypothetical protein
MKTTSKNVTQHIQHKQRQQKMAVTSATNLCVWYWRPICTPASLGYVAWYVREGTLHTQQELTGQRHHGTSDSSCYFPAKAAAAAAAATARWHWFWQQNHS